MMLKHAVPPRWRTACYRNAAGFSVAHEETITISSIDNRTALPWAFHAKSNTMRDSIVLRL